MVTVSKQARYLHTGKIKGRLKEEERQTGFERQVGCDQIEKENDMSGIGDGIGVELTEYVKTHKKNKALKSGQPKALEVKKIVVWKKGCKVSPTSRLHN